MNVWVVPLLICVYLSLLLRWCLSQFDTDFMFFYYKFSWPPEVVIDTLTFLWKLGSKGLLYYICGLWQMYKQDISLVTFIYFKALEISSDPKSSYKGLRRKKLWRLQIRNTNLQKKVHYPHCTRPPLHCIEVILIIAILIYRICDKG